MTKKILHRFSLSNFCNIFSTDPKFSIFGQKNHFLEIFTPNFVTNFFRPLEKFFPRKFRGSQEFLNQCAIIRKKKVKIKKVEKSRKNVSNFSKNRVKNPFLRGRRPQIGKKFFLFFQYIRFWSIKKNVLIAFGTLLLTFLKHYCFFGLQKIPSQKFRGQQEIFFLLGESG